jgi:hypothetical protein
MKLSIRFWRRQDQLELMERMELLPGQSERDMWGTSRLDERRELEATRQRMRSHLDAIDARVARELQWRRLTFLRSRKSATSGEASSP